MFFSSAYIRHIIIKHFWFVISESFYAFTASRRSDVKCRQWKSKWNPVIIVKEEKPGHVYIFSLCRLLGKMGIYLHKKYIIIIVINIIRRQERIVYNILSSRPSCNGCCVYFVFKSVYTTNYIIRSRLTLLYIIYSTIRCKQWTVVFQKVLTLF